MLLVRGRRIDRAPGGRLERIAAVTEPGERVLDMAPGITTGHDGVVVVTDRRLLFVGMRHTLRLPWEAIQDVAVRGRRERSGATEISLDATLETEPFG